MGNCPHTFEGIMALLHPVVSFQHKGRVVRCGESVEDATLSVSAGELRDAVDLGNTL